MSSLTTAISVQVNTKDKEEATKILQNLGVTMSGLINMTIKQVIIRNGIPFEVTTTPFKAQLELLEAIKEGEDILNGKIPKKGYHNVDEMFDDILNEE